MKKILVVDDIPHNLLLVETILRKKLPDCEILLAGSGKECLVKAEIELPETILLDVNMPELNGFEVCKILKSNKLTASIPVLMVSAYGSEPGYRVDGLEAGADAFITKPFDQAELVAMVKVLMRIKNAEDQLRSENNNLETQIKEQLYKTSQNEKRFFQISDFVSEFFWEVDENLLFTYVSPTIEKVLGYQSDDLLLKYHLFDFVSIENREEMKSRFHQIVTTSSSFDSNKILCKNKVGEDIWLLLNGFPIFRKPNELYGYRGVFQNITQRIHDEEKHTLVINTSIDGFVMTDADNNIIEVNEAFCKLTGYTPVEIANRKFSEIDIGDDSSKKQLYFARVKENGYDRFETKLLRKDHQTIDVEISINYLNIIKSQKFIFIRDISERKIIEETKAKNLEMIQAYQKKLKILHSKLLIVEEKERQRMAESLHDGIGQSLAIAYLKLSSINDTTQQIKKSKVISETLQLINQSIRETRSLTYDLSPPILHELGLISALKWKLEKMKDEFGLKTELKNNTDPLNIKNETAILLYRIFSELINNVIKHSKSSDLQIIINKCDNEICFEVIDSGKGFDLVEYASKPKGFGLFNIRERIESIQGRFEIESEIGRGTKVKIFIPN
jgi:PAS domain S-box-containing protein